MTTRDVTRRGAGLGAAALLLLVCLCLSRSVSALSTLNDQILDGSGDTISLKGATWFGFNNNALMVDGLFDPSTGFTYDFATVIYRWQLLGFNAIRLPFSFSDLQKTVNNKRSNTCRLPSFTEIANSVTDPSDNVASGVTFPSPGAWPSHSANTCNEYLPNSGSVFDRFVWVVNYLARNGFYVIIDCHTEDSTPNTYAPNSPSNAFLTGYEALVTAISTDAIARERLIVDVLNEPDARGWGWDRMTQMYLDTMDALYPINPSALFLIEGCGQGSYGANWGDGFRTSGMEGNVGADPNPFFRALLTKPYVSKVAISPHLYGPSVTTASANFSGTGLWNRMQASFGYLTTTGYSGRRFPIVIGEVGSKFQNAGDLQFLPDFRDYLLKAGGAAGYNHNAIPNVIWWSWNDNSGDTGGLIDGGWKNLIWQKVQYLRQLGLRPCRTAAAVLV
ncbi:hypothetical protein FOA52_007962 [Chlamydomonas sp. UWO 241]|nr:hypothetical protein FOA52_007962 [Chlamydomonas sp. UWO 241]